MRTNSKGFSLIEIIVALAILGVVSIGFSTMISQMLGAQKTVQARQDLASIVNEVQMLFAVSTACETGLIPGTNFDFDLAKAAYPAPAGQPAFAFTGQPFRFKVNSDILGDSTTLQNYELIANRVQLVNALAVGTTATGSAVYKAQVIGQFSPKSSGSGGLRDFNTKVLATGYLTVSSAGVITSCSSENFQDISRLTSLCVGLGGIMDPSGKCDFSPDTLDTQALASVCSAFKGKFDGKYCSIASSSSAGSTSEGARWYKSGSCSEYMDMKNSVPAGGKCAALGMKGVVHANPQACKALGQTPQTAVPCSPSGLECFDPILLLGNMAYAAARWTCQ